MKAHLDSITKSRTLHIKQEAENRIKRAMKGQVIEHMIKLVEPGEEVYYKRDINKHWGGHAKVIGRYGKTVVVTHGGGMLLEYISIGCCDC